MAMNDKPQKQQVYASLDGSLFGHAKQIIDADQQYWLHVLAIRGANSNG
ncbi:hypothetical protein [uncultured Shewanella sp.]|nr:hypothetical protein [uncultured Shewanella sp.]